MRTLNPWPTIFSLYGILLLFLPLFFSPSRWLSEIVPARTATQKNKVTRSLFRKRRHGPQNIPLFMGREIEEEFRRAGLTFRPIEYNFLYPIRQNPLPSRAPTTFSILLRKNTLSPPVQKNLHPYNALKQQQKTINYHFIPSHIVQNFVPLLLSHSSGHPPEQPMVPAKTRIILKKKTLARLLL